MQKNFEMKQAVSGLQASKKATDKRIGRLTLTDDGLQIVGAFKAQVSCSDGNPSVTVGFSGLIPQDTLEAWINNELWVRHFRPAMGKAKENRKTAEVLKWQGRIMQSLPEPVSATTLADAKKLIANQRTVGLDDETIDKIVRLQYGIGLADVENESNEGENEE